MKSIELQRFSTLFYPAPLPKGTKTERALTSHIRIPQAKTAASHQLKAVKTLNA